MSGALCQGSRRGKCAGADVLSPLQSQKEPDKLLISEYFIMHLFYNPKTGVATPRIQLVPTAV